MEQVFGAQTLSSGGGKKKKVYLGTLTQLAQSGHPTMTIATALALPAAVLPPPPPVAMVESSSAPVPANVNPQKLKEDDDDDDDHALLQGGPFENAKRKCSWSATSMRKELGSPRMANSEHSHAHAGFGLDGPKPKQILQHQPQSHSNSHPTASLRGGEINTRNKKERSCARNLDTTFLQELGSALVSCGGSGIAGSSIRNRNGSCRGKARIGDGTANSADVSAGDMMTVANSWVRFKDSFQKAVRGDLDAAKEAWRRSTQDFSDVHAVTSVGSHDSILTYDNQSIINHKQAHLLQQEEEAMQLRRLTSWGTVGTYETVETTGGTGLVNSESLSNNKRVAAAGKGPAPTEAESAYAAGVLEDDDGMPIDVELLRTRDKKPESNEKSNKMNEPRRKRVVRFDYPPISSLRECPRTQPEQIEDLFFTEHELEQIEDDRYSTISADDVEIVAISTSTTAESESCDDANSRANVPTNAHGSSADFNSKHPGHPNSLNSPHGNGYSSRGDENNNSNDSSFRNYVATPSKQKKETKKGRRTFAFDDVVNGRIVGASNNTATNESANSKKNISRRRRSSNDANAGHNKKGSPSTTSGSSRRMIKSVQIYLRERSVG